LEGFPLGIAAKSPPPPAGGEDLQRKARAAGNGQMFKKILKSISPHVNKKIASFYAFCFFTFNFLLST
jgi:hypothetical protein